MKQILKNHPKMAKDLKKIHVEFCVESIHGGPEDFLTLKYYSQKMENIQRKFREIDLFHLTSFLAWTFLNSRVGF